jgi:putative inorganic carbon (hco3(-)) transporter
MGFVFTVLYIVLTIISPEQFGQDWANYHVLLYLAGLTAVTSLPAILSESHLKSSIQTYLLIGFIIAIGLSQVANKWFGGAIQSWLLFLPSAAVYFFIVANVTTVRRLKIVALATVGACLVLVVESLCGYYGGFLGDTFVLKMNFSSGDQVVGQILRLRGAGFLNDPNDFAQMLLIALPLIFVAWRQGRVLANSLFVLVPAALLLWATYLTHSRGALIGLGVLGLMAARKKLGTVASVVLTSVLAMGLLALDFTGGRGISASEGADRMGAWATGLELFKHSPVFGVGFGNFTNFSEITAHNSFILPLAELGFVGSAIWVALFVTATMGLNKVIAQRGALAGTDNSRGDALGSADGEDNGEAVSDLTFDADLRASFEEEDTVQRGHEPPGDLVLEEAVQTEEQSAVESTNPERHDSPAEDSLSFAECPPAEESSSFGEFKTPIDSVPKSMVPSMWLELMMLALIAYMTTSWFLSRTYETTTYLVLGLATAAIALEPPAPETQDRSRWVPITLATEVLAVAFLYVIVRFRH